MEGDPHAIVEGMAIGAYAIGAGQGFIYVGHEYPLAATRLRQAIAQAKEKGFLGEKILGTPFSFDIKVRGPGAGTCLYGEETALINFHRGQYRRTPQPPALSGPAGPLGSAYGHK